MPEMRHLFSKNLSDHSLGAFKDLCEGVGVTFEAVGRSNIKGITPLVGECSATSVCSSQTLHVS